MHDVVIVDDEHPDRAPKLGDRSSRALRHRQAHLPAVLSAMAELQDTAGLRRLKRGDPQSDPGYTGRRRRVDAVVLDLDDEQPVG